MSANKKNSIKSSKLGIGCLYASRGPPTVPPLVLGLEEEAPVVGQARLPDGSGAAHFAVLAPRDGPPRGELAADLAGEQLRPHAGGEGDATVGRGSVSHGRREQF